MSLPATLPFTKGHGTENDFVLIPDPDGVLRLTAPTVRALCDRRAGVGGDGVIRVVRTAHADEQQVRALAPAAEWFMDYRNADGDPVEMCGNGTRVFAAYLRRSGWVTGQDLAIATRCGVKQIRLVPAPANPPGSAVTQPPAAHSGPPSDAVPGSAPPPDAGPGAAPPPVHPPAPAPWFAVNLGSWRLVDDDAVRQDGFDAAVTLPGLEPLPAMRIDVGNPHTVVALPEHIDLAAIDLSRPPLVSPDPPAGTNVEVVRALGPGRLRMRVHERGVGETRSCGTGAAAAALALRHWAGPIATDEPWSVLVPGGRLQVRVLPAGDVELSGPAVLVADGSIDPAALRRPEESPVAARQAPDSAR